MVACVPARMNRTIIMTTMKDSKQYYVRRPIVAAALAFIVFALAGIAFRGWHEYRRPVLEPFTVSELLFVSLVGPLAAAVMIAPITLVVLTVFVIMVCIGSRSKRIWLSLCAFGLMGLYWLFLVEFIREFALMD